MNNIGEDTQGSFTDAKLIFWTAAYLFGLREEFTLQGKA